jgi:hypothetical protein
MTSPKFYFTFSLIDKVTKEPVGWNSEVASTEEQAIKQALNRLSCPDSDYMVDESSFIKQTDEEMEKLMIYTA